MKCPKCQHDVPDDSMFCNKCGYDLNKVIGKHSDTYNEPQSYTPKHLADKILKTKSAIEGERKQVTVLFADVANFTSMSEKLDPENVHQIMDGCFKILMDEIHGHKGTINQFTGDGVMSLFGAPLALEDHAQDACRAALAIQKMMKRYSRDLQTKYGIQFQMRIGINSGSVVVGAIGDDLRMDYTAVGDTTNLAARMESLAKPGTVLVSPNTYKKVSQQFELKSHGETKIKGKEEPLEVYELIKDNVYRPRLGQERQIYSEMVGRDSDLNKLELQVSKAVNGEGSVVNVIGEAGIGKSRLIAELKNRDVIKRVAFLEGRAISIGRNLSFYPIINLLKHWARINEDDTETSSLSKLETAVRGVSQKDADEIIPFVATLMGMKLSGRYAKRVKGIEGEALEKLILKNVKDLIKQAAGQMPLVIVIEDLHWADESSIELLEFIFRLAEANRILFINVFRPHHKETGDRITQIIKERLPVYYIEIKLEPLTEQMSETLIGNMLNIKGLDYGIRSRIVQRSGGNPFFIEEVARSFLDTGAVIVKGSKFEVTDKIGEVVIPHTINDVLMARIDRLEDETRDLIKIASVIGRNFFHKILTEVAKTIESIDSRLSYLKEIQLIRERKRMEELEYLFKHALAQETAYESILQQKRKELHHKVADAIEKIFEEKLHEFYGTLAYHYINGENFDKAEEYMLKAGEEAMKSSASSEALHYYQRAIEIYIKKHGDNVDKKRVAGMEENIAYAFLNKGLFVEAVDYFDRSFSNRGETAIKNTFIVIIKVIINLLVIIRNLYLPSIGNKKVPTDLDNQNMNRILKIGTALSSIDIQRCFVTNLEAIKKTLKYDISNSQFYFNMRCAGVGLFSISGISMNIAKKILEHTRKGIDKKSERMHFRVYTFAETLYNCLAGNWCGEINEDIINNGLKSGDLFFISGYLLFLGYMKIEMGDFKICERIINKSNNISEEYNYEHARSDFYVLSSIFLMKKGKAHDAIDYVNKGALHEDNVSGDARRVELLGIKSRIEIAQYNLDAAKQSLEEAEKLIRQVGKDAIFSNWYCKYLMGRFYYNLAMLENAVILSNQSDFGQYKKSALKSGKIAVTYARKKVALDRTEAYKLMGRYYWLTNQHRKALKWWNKSIKEGELLGARPELSRTYKEIGMRLLEPKSKDKELNGMTAQEYLSKARNMFQDMDLQYDLDDLDKIVASN